MKCGAYFTGTRHRCAEGLCRALKEHPQAELVIVGHLDLPELFAPFESRIKRLPLMRHHDMLRELATIDVNLAPLEPANLFTECKSELKIVEAALFAIPTIASPTPTYAAVIEDGKSGCLAATPDEWHNSLSALIKDGALRQRIGEAASDSIAARYAVTSAVNEAKAICAAAITGTLRPASRNPGRSRTGGNCRLSPRTRMSTVRSWHFPVV